MSWKYLLLRLASLLLSFPLALHGELNLHSTVPESVGLNIHFLDARPGEMKMLAASGVRWVRMDFSWSAIEMQKGKYDFSAYDRLLAALLQYHIQPIFILAYSNVLYDGGLSPYSDEGMHAFARWAVASVSHFRGHGILWEMYNEPNGRFWRPRTDVQAYIRLALFVGEAIHQVAPAESCIGPASLGVDLRFLEACFKAGLLNYWSAVSVHPYRNLPPETAAAEFRALRLLINRYARRGKQVPIVAGEWGYSSVWEGVTEGSQGEMLAREWLHDLANDVTLSIWYDWQDDGPDPKDQEAHFGIVHFPYHSSHDPVLSPKPAYWAAHTLTGILNGYRFNKRLAVGSPEDYVLLFTRNGQIRLAVWTASPRPHEVAVPASPGGFRATSCTGRRLANLEAGKNGLPITLTHAPEYLEPERPNPLLRVAAAWERLPLEITAPAPKQAEVTLHLRNPLPTRVRVKSEPNLRAVGAPGQELSLGAAAHVMATTAPAPLRLEWEIVGMGRIAQETRLVATNPLEVTLVPANGEALPLGVENPSGAVFRGVIALTNVAGLRPSRTELPLEFKAGETQKALRVSLEAATESVYGFGALIKSAEGEVMMREAAARFIRVDDFARYASGTPAPGYRLVTNGNPRPASEEGLTASCPPGTQPYPGMACLKITYRFAAQSNLARLVPPPHRVRAIAGKPKALGVWVYGDGSGNLARMRFVDATGQTFQGKGQRLTWKGWHYLLFAMNAVRADHWGGANDGVIHYPIRWDTLLLVESAARGAMQGEIYISCPTLVF